MLLNTRGWARIRSEDSDSVTTPALPRPIRSRAPRLELLESRRLLSTRFGPSANLSVTTPAGEFQIQVSGSGVVEAQPTTQGAINLTAYGTTATSTITIIQTQARFHFRSQRLAIQSFVVASRQLGGLAATPAQLNGKMTTLINSMTNFDIGGLGPQARVNIAGGLGELSATTINLGSKGRVSIAGGMNATDASSSPSGSFTLGAMTITTMSLNGGRFVVGADTTGPILVQGNLTISQSGLFSIGRDEGGSLTVGGSLVVQSGGELLVGRNLNNLTVDGNLIVGPSDSGIAVNGALNGLTVNGYFQGQAGTANPAVIDLGVGLDLSGLTILSGVTGQGGLITANIRAGGSVSGVDIPYGRFKSTIQTNAAMTT